MDKLRLCESEYRLAALVWDNEPISSGELVILSNKHLGWKKSTTYTVLKKLCERSILLNDESKVQSLVKKEQVQKFESEQLITKSFGGSLPQFLTAFMGDKKISMQEAEQLKKIIDSYKED